MSVSDRPWPPLIVVRVPTWMRWRDYALTGLMWGLILFLLGNQFDLFLGPDIRRLGVRVLEDDVDWSEFYPHLTPFLGLAAGLALVLFVFSLLTLRRRSRALLLPAPEPLSPAEEAARAGVAQDTLLTARELRIAVVHIADDGRHRFEPR